MSKKKQPDSQAGKVNNIQEKNAAANNQADLKKAVDQHGNIPKKVLHIAENKKTWFLIVIVLMIVSLGSICIRGLNYGIDFVGGTIITIDLHTQFDTTETRTITDKYDKYADITYSGNDKTNIIISTQKDLSTDERQEIFNDFKDAYKLKDADLISVDTVTPTVGNEMTRNAFIATVIAVLLMLVYIWFRFELFFGISAVVALIFDIINVVGFYSLFQVQVNTPFIAAILTILGYSINDTIVVFDRIRENQKMGLFPHNREMLVDVSITQTIKRSIYTVVTTLLAIVSLYIFGVSAIQSFALPLIVGIISGCYSSIWVASPLWLVLQEKFPHFTDKKKKKVKQKTASKQPVV